MNTLYTVLFDQSLISSVICLPHLLLPRNLPSVHRFLALSTWPKYLSLRCCSCTVVSRRSCGCTFCSTDALVRCAIQLTSPSAVVDILSSQNLVFVFCPQPSVSKFHTCIVSLFTLMFTEVLCITLTS